jgi:hypothetical protein
MKKLITWEVGVIVLIIALIGLVGMRIFSANDGGTPPRG